MSLGGAGAGGMPSNAGAGAGPLSFAVDIWPMFDTLRDPIFEYYDGSTYESCTTTGVCHGGQVPGAGLRMPDAETAYAQLLDVASRSDVCEGTVRVVAGEPESSCLIRFYEIRLRDELAWTGDAEIDRVRRWIDEGALP
jgi:hypothetical protein